jgi:hypothetical protein
MELVRDVLDKPVVDRHGHAMGRADAVVLEWRKGAAPLVRSIAIGPVPLAHRLHPRLGRLVERLERWLGLSARRPIEVPFSKVHAKEMRVMVDVTAGDTGSSNVELAVRSFLRRLTWT